MVVLRFKVPHFEGNRFETEEDNLEHLHDFTASLRKATFYTVEEVESYTGLVRTTIQRYENGKIKKPPIGYLACLAEKFALSLHFEGEALDAVRAGLMKELNSVMKACPGYQGDPHFFEWESVEKCAAAFLEQSRKSSGASKPSTSNSQGSEKRTFRAPAYLLPPRPAHYSGRDKAVQWIKSALEKSGDKAVVQGTPGIGKSAFLSKLAYDPEIRTAFPDGILWAALGPEPDLFSLLARWWRRLGMDLSGCRDLDEIAAALRGELAWRKFLLLVDDVWDARHAAPFQVGGNEAFTVFTTRLPGEAFKLAGTAQIYTLPALDLEEATHLFRSWAGEVEAAYSGQCRELLEIMERLPLGVCAAARFLAREAYLDGGVEELLSELTGGLALLKLEATGYEQGGHDPGVNGLSLPTIELILRKSTDRLSPLLREAFTHLALLNFKPARFGLDTVAEIWREECEISAPRPILAELLARGLVDKADKHIYHIHAVMYYHALSLFRQKYGA